MIKFIKMALLILPALIININGRAKIKDERAKGSANGQYFRIVKSGEEKQTPDSNEGFGYLFPLTKVILNEL